MMDKRYAMVAALWFFQVANYFDRTVIGFAGPAMTKSLGMGPGAFGIVLSSFALGYTLAQIPGGIAADRWGSKFVLVVSPLLWALFTGLTGLVSGLAAFVVVRTCLGLSEGLSNSASAKVIGDAFSSRERAFVGGLWTTSFAIGPALAGPVVGLLLISYGWRALFVVLMLPTVLAAVVNLLLIPGRAPSRIVTLDRAVVAPALPGAWVLKEIAREPTFWILSVSWFLFMGVYWAYLGWMPSYLASAHHIDLKAAGPIAGLPYVFGIGGMLLIGWLGSHGLYRFRPQLVAGCFVLAAAALYVAFSASGLAGSIAGLSAAAFFIYAAIVVFGAIILEYAPDHARAAYWGAVSTIGQLAGVVAPAAIGFLVAATGSFAGGFGLMVGALVVAAVPMLILAFNRPPALAIVGVQ